MMKSFSVKILSRYWNIEIRGIMVKAIPAFGSPTIISYRLHSGTLEIESSFRKYCSPSVYSGRGSSPPHTFFFSVFRIYNFFYIFFYIKFYIFSVVILKILHFFLQFCRIYIFFYIFSKAKM